MTVGAEKVTTGLRALELAEELGWECHPHIAAERRSLRGGCSL